MIRELLEELKSLAEASGGMERAIAELRGLLSSGSPDGDAVATAWFAVNGATDSAYRREIRRDKTLYARETAALKVVQALRKGEPLTSAGIDAINKDLDGKMEVASKPVKPPAAYARGKKQYPKFEFIDGEKAIAAGVKQHQLAFAPGGSLPETGRFLQGRFSLGSTRKTEHGKMYIIAVSKSGESIGVRVG